MKITIRVPAWIVRKFMPKTVADLDRRAQMSGKASRSIVAGTIVDLWVEGTLDSEPKKEPGG